MNSSAPPKIITSSVPITKAKLSYRYSKGRESVINLFGKSKPDQASTLVLSNKKEPPKEVKNVLLSNLNNEQLFDIATNILQKPTSSRNINDIKTLVKSTENVGFFRKMIDEGDTTTHEQCCKYITHKFVQAGEVIFKEGSIGTTFYIILKGSVSIYITPKHPESNSPQSSPKRISIMPKKKSMIPSENLQAMVNNVANSLFAINKMESMRNPKLSLSPLMRLQSKEVISLDPNNLKNDLTNARRLSRRVATTEFLNPPVDKKWSFFENELEIKKIKTIGQGGSFGELALMENKPRAATILCEENCHFAILEKEFFNGILREKQEKILFQEIEFFVSMKIFNHWSYHTVKKLYLAMTKMDFRKNKFVFKEKDAADDIFFVNSGEFKVLKTFRYSLKKTHLKEQIEELSPKIGNYSLTCISDPSIKSKTLEVALLQRGEIFGEEELLSPGITRQTSVICNSAVGSIYVLKKDDFYRFISSDEKTRELLTKKQEEKDEFRTNCFNNFFQLITHESDVTRTFTQVLRSREEQKELIDFALPDSTILKSQKKTHKLERAQISDTMISPQKLIKTISDSHDFHLFSPNAAKKNFFMLRNFLKRKGNGKKLMTSARKSEKKNKDIFKKLNFTHVSNFSSRKEIKIFNLNTEGDIKETSIKENAKKQNDESDYEEITKRSISVPSIYTVPFSNNRIRDFMMNDINEERDKLKIDMAKLKLKSKFTQILKLERILYKNNSALKKLNNNTDDLIIQSEEAIQKNEKKSETNKCNNNNEMTRNSLGLNELIYLPLKYQSSFWKTNK